MGATIEVDEVVVQAVADQDLLRNGRDAPGQQRRHKNGRGKYG